MNKKLTELDAHGTYPRGNVCQELIKGFFLVQVHEINNQNLKLVKNILDSPNLYPFSPKCIASNPTFLKTKY